jgi:DNA sulfur modification protein DndC
LTRTPSLWESDRRSMERSIALTSESLQTSGPLSYHWAVAFSGGKDSTATVTLLAHLIAAGQIAPHETLTVLYTDTRMELPPLHGCALTLLNELAQRGMRTQVVLPDLHDRFFVSLFGRGIPTPKNRFRWSTSQLNMEPMERALADLREAAGEKLLSPADAPGGVPHPGLADLSRTHAGVFNAARRRILWRR